MRKVSLAIQPLEIPKYSVITKDNADIAASITLNYMVKNPERYVYNNTDSEQSMIDLVRGHLRDIIGKMDLNEALGKTNVINDELFKAIDNLTEIFGLKVIRINIDELIPSEDIQRAMDRQLTAEREKTAAIAKAEGKAKNIELTNKAQNEAIKATDEANAQATKTTADAEAEAYRIDKVNEALNNASEGYFRNMSINSFNNVADGKNNLVVMDKDNIDKLGTIPVAKKLLGLDERTRENEGY